MEYPYFRMRRAGRNPRVFWLSWVDLDGIESTFMFFHSFRPLQTNCVFCDGRMIIKFDVRGYSSSLSDFPVQTSMSQRWKLLDQEKSVASRACWKLLEKENSVASRACWKSFKQDVASRACWKLLEKETSVASRTCWKSFKKDKSIECSIKSVLKVTWKRK